MYSDIKLCVKSKQRLSKTFSSTCGIRQGDILSPQLFNIFINDFPGILDESSEAPLLTDTVVHSLIYADDLILLSKSEQGLQSSMKKLEEFCNEWHLSVNTQKSKVMVFNKQGKLLKCTIKYNDHPLESVRSHTYLEIKISCKGNFEECKNDLYSKGLKAYFKLCKNIGQNDLHIDTAIHLFDHTVRQILLYGAEIWGQFSCKSTKLRSTQFKIERAYEGIQQEKINIKFCKFILNVNKYACNNGVRGELGRYPLHIDIILAMIKFWIRFEKQDTSRLLKEAYKCNLNLHEQNIETWTTSIFTILKELKLDFLLQQKNKDPQHIIPKVKKLLKQRYENYWQESMHNDKRPRQNEQNKLRTYRKFKINFEKEEYLHI